CRLELNRREVSDHVGCDVRMWIAHLVDQLLRYQRKRDRTTSVWMLRDDERPISRRLDDGIADVGEIGNVLPIVEAVAARALPTALDGVSRDESRRDTITGRVG